MAFILETRGKTYLYIFIILILIVFFSEIPFALSD